MEDETCAVCLGGIAQYAVLSSCDHVFCVPCILEWMPIQTKCPLCKSNVSCVAQSTCRVTDADAKKALLEDTDKIVWKQSVSDLIAQAFAMYNYSVPVAVLRQIIDNQ
ncbi:RING-finger-containing E3 ubiquitin ligase [Three spot gourami iridovirus]|nr:RING-finger-containing E3 ubiquitin ligase [South American cichlid iridovirus]AVR29860.1 RING-finger-containing E3 ubiquitin ligase [Three spot gourami iridovirus]